MKISDILFGFVLGAGSFSLLYFSTLKYEPPKKKRENINECEKCKKSFEFKELQLSLPEDGNLMLCKNCY